MRKNRLTSMCFASFLEVLVFEQFFCIRKHTDTHEYFQIEGIPKQKYFIKLQSKK